MLCPCYIASVLPCIPHKGSLIPKSSTFQGCWGLLRCYTCLGSFRCFWEKQARIELHGLEDDFLKHSFTKYLVQYRGFSEVCAKYLTILNIIKCLELILTYSREIIPKNNSNKKPWKYKVNTKQSLVAYCNDSRKKQSSLSLKKKKKCSQCRQISPSAGVPNSYWEPGCTAEGELRGEWVREASSAAPHSSPLLTLLSNISSLRARTIDLKVSNQRFSKDGRREKPGL